jgi:hypothetical protein
MTEIPPRLQQLIDRQDIGDVLTSYCRGVDRVDADIFRTVFWQDGGYETGAGGFFSAGDENFATQILHETIRHQYVKTQHFLTNFRCAFASTLIADAEVYFYAFHRPHPTADGLALALGESRAREILAQFSGTEFDVIAGGRYVDRLEKRGGEWRIKRRRLITDWTSIAPATEWGLDNTLGNFQFHGARYPEDASYVR